MIFNTIVLYASNLLYLFQVVLQRARLNKYIVNFNQTSGCQRWLPKRAASILDRDPINISNTEEFYSAVAAASFFLSFFYELTAHLLL